MKILVWSLIALLVVLHQDVWFWDADRLIFGFMPVALLYHACISVAASGLWLLAVNVAWPADDELIDEPAVGGTRIPASERPVPKEKTNPRFAGGDDMQGAPA
ncbi:DUF3311 domain-containing protein [Alienimonas chondri]|uniref:DUF3311 domain-containing protein n=1 Tax=Alienimonas chondri TaxID=2681879 RepID=A0ABX1VEA5_9PLAN|nr:DUF3311 domain-containing protein [Alienimonas chondri]NNJ26439.1 hypothetical protein [Alienimonas chondri]